MAEFLTRRTTLIKAEPAAVHAILNDFSTWQSWSPWEEMDPDLQRTFSGAATGVGSRYAWKGNRKVGQGSMEITDSSPERIEIDLEFLKPMKASNKTVFELTPVDGQTQVDWTMSGQRGFVMDKLGKAFFDKAIVADFDRGLAKLRAVAEATSR